MRSATGTMLLLSSLTVVIALLPSPLWAIPAQVTFGAQGCFPALGFEMPSATPPSLDGWWCDMSDEYAFVGFSYEVTACKHVTHRPPVLIFLQAKV